MSEAKKKVLVITYYWPPSGGSGVQRWLKFVKYLPSFGWEPWVFTPESPSFNIRDESLLADVPPEAEVIRFPIWEPYGFYFRIGRFFGRKVETPADQVASGRRSLFQSVSSWIRGNLFIPDARVFWVKPSANFLKGIITQHQIQYVITTGPPHSVHLIGLRLKHTFKEIQWLADFRDPWSEWNLLDTLSLTNISRLRHIRLERKVLHAADVVLTIGPYFVGRFRKLGARRVEMVTNGYDESDFESLTHRRSEYFTIRHTGIVDELRNPRPFLDALVKAGRQAPELMARIRVEFVGDVNAALRDEVKSDPDLHNVVDFKPPIPHAQLLQLYGETDLLLLVLGTNEQAQGNLPGKFFEYMASGNPILAIGPTDGDTAKILVDSKSGAIYSPFDLAGIRDSLISQFTDWKTGPKSSRIPPSDYSRRNLTARLLRILESEG